MPRITKLGTKTHLFEKRAMRGDVPVPMERGCGLPISAFGLHVLYFQDMQDGVEKCMLLPA
jgi:hypothetical protein